MFLLNLILALIWMIFNNTFGLEGFISGGVLGAVILFAMERALGETGYWDRILLVVSFLIFIAWNVIVSNVTLAQIILAKKLKVQSKLILIPLDLKTDLALTFLACLITITPGVISLDLTDDRQMLIVHTLNISDYSTFQVQMKEFFESRVAELFE
jgi:multicomponent Na+:H+ antiporter subunit E